MAQERVPVPEWAIVCTEVSTAGDIICAMTADAQPAPSAAQPAGLISGLSGLDFTHPLSKAIGMTGAGEGNGSRPSAMLVLSLPADHSRQGTATKPTVELHAGTADLDAAEKGGHGSDCREHGKAKVSAMGRASDGPTWRRVQHNVHRAWQRSAGTAR